MSLSIAAGLRRAASSKTVVASSAASATTSGSSCHPFEATSRRSRRADGVQRRDFSFAASSRQDRTTNQYAGRSSSTSQSRAAGSSSSLYPRSKSTSELDQHRQPGLASLSPSPVQDQNEALSRFRSPSSALAWKHKSEREHSQSPSHQQRQHDQQQTHHQQQQQQQRQHYADRNYYNTSHSSSSSRRSQRHNEPEEGPESDQNRRRSSFMGSQSFYQGVAFGLALGVGMTVWRGCIEMEPADGGNGSSSSSRPSTSTAQFGLDQVTLICLVGVPGSGKTTQAKRMQERFKGFELLSNVDSVQKLEEAVKSRRARPEAKGKETQLIVDSLPLALEDTRKLEASLCPVFVVLYFDLPKDISLKRGNDGREWDQASERLQPLVDHFRNRGNILEISADWPSADEVWEQVEAKTEQVLELKAMGEDVSV